MDLLREEWQVRTVQEKEMAKQMKERVMRWQEVLGLNHTEGELNIHGPLRH